ncbi:hypothetical protein HHI36_014821 [Cryptolaemus montrouzieri]|uniref:Uncharacterized protein n=1 Tax=Cryptolaemus montrouzieri TaxID=559131 RepID=A0ABD2N3V2_9CUCU
MKRYDIFTIGGEEKLIAPMKEDNEEIKYYVCYDDLLNILEESILMLDTVEEQGCSKNVTASHEKDMIGLLKSEENLENVLHSRKNYENMIEQDKENNVVGNESERIKKGNSKNPNNKTQEKEIIALEETTEKQITDDSDYPNLTIQIQTDLEIERAIQAEQDPIPKKIESIQTIRTKAKFNSEN